VLSSIHLSHIGHVDRLQNVQLQKPITFDRELKKVFGPTSKTHLVLTGDASIKTMTDNGHKKVIVMAGSNHYRKTSRNLRQKKKKKKKNDQHDHQSSLSSPLSSRALVLSSPQHKYILDRAIFLDHKLSSGVGYAE